MLLDDIMDNNGGFYEVDVTLPDDMPCEDCTLQLVQVLKDFDGEMLSGLYFSCIDFALDGDSLDEPPSGTDSGGDSDGDGDGDADGDGDGSVEGDSDGDAGQDDGTGDFREVHCGCNSHAPLPVVGFALVGLWAAFSRRRVGS